MRRDVWCDFGERLKIPGTFRLLDKNMPFIDFAGAYEEHFPDFPIVFYDDIKSKKDFTGFAYFTGGKVCVNHLNFEADSGYFRNGGILYLQDAHFNKKSSEVYFRNGFTASRIRKGREILINQKKVFLFNKASDMNDKGIVYVQSSPNIVSLHFVNLNIKENLARGFNLKYKEERNSLNTLLSSLEGEQPQEFFKKLKVLNNGKVYLPIKEGVEKLFPNYV